MTEARTQTNDLMLLTPQAPPLRADLGGVIRVGPTRVTLETVLTAYKMGHSPAEIVSAYPSLAIADVFAVIAYYHWNAEAMEAYLSRQLTLAEEARRDAEGRPEHAAMREKLLSRRAAGKTA